MSLRTKWKIPYPEEIEMADIKELEKRGSSTRSNVAGERGDCNVCDKKASGRTEQEAYNRYTGWLD